MSQRRMFSPQIIDTDAFLDMSTSAQSLYFHLGMRADDDGFVGNPKKILRMIGGNDDDLKMLIVKRFVLTFESGVIVIKHWRINNLIRKDWYKETAYTEEKALLSVKENGSYTMAENNLVNENVTKPPRRLGKVSIVKDIYIESSPLAQAKEFFNNIEEQVRVTYELINKGYNEQLVKNEITKFISYWTEPNKSGTKQRWELEKTFEISRRLATWFSRVNNFNNQPKSKFVTI